MKLSEVYPGLHLQAPRWLNIVLNAALAWDCRGGHGV